jgi:hypothetical protein
MRDGAGRHAKGEGGLMKNIIRGILVVLVLVGAVH